MLEPRALTSSRFRSERLKTALDPVLDMSSKGLRSMPEEIWERSALTTLR